MFRLLSSFTLRAPAVKSSRNRQGCRLHVEELETRNLPSGLPLPWSLAANLDTGHFSPSSADPLVRRDLADAQPAIAASRDTPRQEGTGSIPLIRSYISYLLPPVSTSRLPARASTTEMLPPVRGRVPGGGPRTSRLQGTSGEDPLQGSRAGSGAEGPNHAAARLPSALGRAPTQPQPAADSKSGVSPLSRTGGQLDDAPPRSASQALGVSGVSSTLLPDRTGGQSGTLEIQAPPDGSTAEEVLKPGRQEPPQSRWASFSEAGPAGKEASQPSPTGSIGLRDTALGAPTDAASAEMVPAQAALEQPPAISANQAQPLEHLPNSQGKTGFADVEPGSGSVANTFGSQEEEADLALARDLLIGGAVLSLVLGAYWGAHAEKSKRLQYRLLRR